MAYSMFEERQIKNLKHKTQYIPEESDVPDKSDFSDTKFYYNSPRMKQFNKIIPEVHYMNDRKCPIYVHEYNKIQIPSDNTYNNHSSKSFAKSVGTKSKSSNSQSSKSMLDKLEETYWATWKPSRDKHAKSPRRNKISKNEAYGDTSDTLVKYFEKSNFKSSSASMDDANYRYNGRTVQSTRLIEMSTQEIQTEDLTTVDESVDQRDEQELVEGNEDDELKVSERETTLKKDVEISTELVNGDETDTVPVKENLQEGCDEVSKSKLLQHKDSFIIHKKKQDEVKESFQQPKCIKLFKKTGSTYLRGGTYPLKSCLRSDSTPKGHFRLGPPGSPMFVTSNSFNRKYGK